MNYELPTRLEVGGKEWVIRADYRAALDIFAALSDPELTPQDKAEAALTIFYPDFEDMQPGIYQEALQACFRFLNGGKEEQGPRGPQLVDWEQDFEYIAAPISRVLGKDIRGISKDDGMVTPSAGLHWWTFLSAYLEIGECLFAQIVRIRHKKAKGTKLSKEERKWYNEHRYMVDIKKTYSEQEEEVLKGWGA